MPKGRAYGPLLLHRFGPDILSDGYEVAPGALEKYRVPLRVTLHEARFLVYLWNKWKLYEEQVSLSVEAIAAALHVSVSQVKRYTHALKKKGLLDVSLRRGRGKHNWYDLRPLCEKLRALVRGFPLPRRRGEITTQPYKNTGIVQPRLSHVKEELWASMDSISRQFKDTAPKSSLTRAARLWFTLSLPLEDYKDWIQEARQRTKDFWANAEKPMPYFFAILEKGPHARIDQADLRAGLDPRPAAPASAEESASAQEPPADEAGFYWDDSPLPAMEQEAPAPVNVDSQEQPEEETLADLAGLVNEAPTAPASAPAADTLPGASPIDELIERKATAGAARYQFGRSTAPALRPLPKVEADYWADVVRLNYPAIQYLADDDTWHTIQNESDWQHFKEQSSPNEQDNAKAALVRIKRGNRSGLISSAGRWLNDSAAGLI